MDRTAALTACASFASEETEPQKVRNLGKVAVLARDKQRFRSRSQALQWSRPFHFARLSASTDLNVQLMTFWNSKRKIQHKVSSHSLYPLLFLKPWEETGWPYFKKRYLSFREVSDLPKVETTQNCSLRSNSCPH